MSITAMRNYLKSYPKYKKSPKWVTKVDNMPDSQVIAVYYSMINRKIDRKVSKINHFRP